MTEFILFWVFAPIAVVAALGMVLARKAVHSALFLIANFSATAPTGESRGAKAGVTLPANPDQLRSR